MFPNAILNDGYGASETGAQARSFGGGKFASFDDETLVLDPDDARRDRAGLGTGRPGRPPRAHPDRATTTIPRRRPRRSSSTTASAGCSPATWPPCSTTAPSSCSVAGRCASTPAARRSSPRRSRACCSGIPRCTTPSSSVSPTRRWGERVTAVVQVTPGHDLDEDALLEHCRAQLAGYKLPRSIVAVEAVQRSPVGKADYGWAKEAAVKEKT